MFRFMDIRRPHRIAFHMAHRLSTASFDHSPDSINELQAIYGSRGRKLQP